MKQLFWLIMFPLANFAQTPNWFVNYSAEDSSYAIRGGGNEGYKLECREGKYFLKGNIYFVNLSDSTMQFLHCVTRTDVVLTLASYKLSDERARLSPGDSIAISFKEQVKGGFVLSDDILGIEEFQSEKVRLRQKANDLVRLAYQVMGDKGSRLVELRQVGPIRFSFHERFIKEIVKIE